VGALLAIVCWGLATHGDPQIAATGYAGVLAAGMVAAGAASFVLHTLHGRAQGGPSPAGAAWATARRLIMLLGVSFSGWMYALNLCLPG
jgi:hypothetical protein